MIGKSHGYLAQRRKSPTFA